MRTRLLAAGILAVVLGLAAMAFTSDQEPSPGGGQGGTSEGGEPWGVTDTDNGSEQLPPVVAFLQQVPPAQRFDHLRDTTVNITDQNGAPVAINYVPGTVSSISGTSLVVTPNGQTTTRAFNVTANTRFRGTPARGSNAVVSAGDRVVVTTVGSSSDAVLVQKYLTPPAGTPPPAPGTATPAAGTGTPGVAGTPTP